MLTGLFPNWPGVFGYSQHGKQSNQGAKGTHHTLQMQNDNRGCDVGDSVTVTVTFNSKCAASLIL